MGCALKIMGSGGNPQDKTMMEKRFLLVGLDNAGKTSILYRLAKKETMETAPTVGLNVEQIVIRDLNITFWDLGGEATMLWKHYYQQTDGIIFVIDSTDRERMEAVKEELTQIDEDQDLLDCPLLVLANKQDLKIAMKPEELAELIEFDKMKKKQKFLEPCSATNNEGLLPAIDKLVDIIIKVTPKQHCNQIQRKL